MTPWGCVALPLIWVLFLVAYRIEARLGAFSL